MNFEGADGPYLVLQKLGRRCKTVAEYETDPDQQIVADSYPKFDGEKIRSCARYSE